MPSQDRGDRPFACKFLTLQFSLKDWVSETATHGQQQRLSWDKLDHLMSEEPQLLCQESKRLQTAVQNTKADLTHSREKVTQKPHNVESDWLDMKVNCIMGPKQFLGIDSSILWSPTSFKDEQFFISVYLYIFKLFSFYNRQF